ncbi:MAG: metal-dependent hydrolase [Halolamina sp.]
MMATTHALAGLLLVIPLAVVAPEFTVAAAVAAIAGGVFPDIDMPWAHRRTLHFPVYYSIAAAIGGGVALLAPTSASVAAALFLGSAALHSLSDAFGGGLELRPWEGSSERGVYSHYHRRWWRPRRWVRYDGAPEDAALGILLGVPPVLIFEGHVELFVIGAVALGLGYAAIRRPMVEWTQRLVDSLPPELLDRLPDRLVEDFR